MIDLKRPTPLFLWWYDATCSFRNPLVLEKTGKMLKFDKISKNVYFFDYTMPHVLFSKTTSNLKIVNMIKCLNLMKCPKNILFSCTKPPVHFQKPQMTQNDKQNDKNDKNKYHNLKKWLKSTQIIKWPKTTFLFMFRSHLFDFRSRQWLKNV